LNTDGAFRYLNKTNDKWMALLDPEGAGHFVLVNGLDDVGRVKILGPRGYEYKLTQDNFFKLWQDSGEYGGVVFKQ
jgi:hypothetical protein